jgi:hypothetical protein
MTKSAGDESAKSAMDAMFLVRGLVQYYEHLRPIVLERLLSSFEEIKDGVVFRGSLVNCTVVLQLNNYFR